MSSGESSKVYETNFAAINGDQRFVQAQLIANRLGSDPIDVQFTQVNASKATTETMICFNVSTKTLSYFLDGTQVGVAQAIDRTGLDDWNLNGSDPIDIGIMGFAENTMISEQNPTMDNFTVNIFD